MPDSPPYTPAPHAASMAKVQHVQDWYRRYTAARQLTVAPPAPRPARARR